MNTETIQETNNYRDSLDGNGNEVPGSGGAEGETTNHHPDETPGLTDSGLANRERGTAPQGPEERHLTNPTDGVPNRGTGSQQTSVENDTTPSHNRPEAESQGNNTRKKTKKGSLKIASLNMKGGGSGRTEYKWNEMNQLMRDNRIDILAVQETHLSTDALERLQRTHESRLHIIASASSSSRAGVAVILNKTTMPWKEASSKEIIPGRAMLVTIPWSSSIKMTFLAIYAPNATADNADFWRELTNTWANTRLPKPACVLGDFNIVEDAVDRAPAHRDPQRATSELADLKNSLRLADGWRRENPDKIDFSFRMEGRDIMSRIDRIYLRENLLDFSNEWKIERTGIMTDHAMVSVKLLNPWMPYQGPGRYAMPVFLLEQDTLMEDIRKIGAKYLEKSEASAMRRTEGENPQTLHARFKEDAVRKVREHAKKMIPKITKEIERLKKERLRLLNNSATPEHERREEASILDERIRDLERIKFGRTRDNIATNFFLEGETLKKTWINANKEKKPRDTIIALKDHTIENSPLVRRSSDMAEVMRKHHETLQTQGAPLEDAEYITKVDKVLERLERRLNPGQRDKMGEVMEDHEINTAMKSMPNGKAAGMDGIPNELWKNLHSSFEKPKKRTDTKFDIIKALRLVYEDIQAHGVDERTGFSEGWLCPIYKKGDRTEAGNYRPITVLNTDYKILTKVLSNRISEVAGDLIHPDQAGFMKGRRIEDQTELANAIIDWAEITETNGMIMCLDQEKAYDKILHTFLWKTLERLNFPATIINLIKSLYKGAKTVVMINGELSLAFLVIRGVRQGDPLSCLLFNLAIESLAEALRKSNLKGIQIEGQLERLITTLFADDTTVYLSEDDSVLDVQSILDEWCSASGGKFNVPKTAIVPIGGENFRRSMAVARTARIPEAPIQDGIHIVGDGETTRLLGAFIGNKIDNPSVWTPTVEKIASDLERWNKGNPTIDGRCLLVGMIVGGRTQYKTSVQGMPADVLALLNKMIRNFIWNSDTVPAVSTRTLQLDRKDGGKNLLCLEARNEAIELMRLKRYLNFGDGRPKWALVVDTILGMNITKGSRVRDSTTYVNAFLQNISVNSRAKEETLPKSTKQMMKTAKTHGVAFAPLLLDNELKRRLPIWFHLGLSGEKGIQFNSRWAVCQRTNHKIRTTGDMVDFTRSVQADIYPEHRNVRECDCGGCLELQGQGCENPTKCMENATKLLDKLGNRWDPRSDTDQVIPPPPNLIEDESLFDMDYTTRGNLKEAFRVFTDSEARDLPRHVEVIGPEGEVEERIVIYTDGSCTGNGTEEATAGAGLWIADEDERNRAIRVPPTCEQTNNAGEALAVLEAIRVADDESTLIIASDSQVTLQAMTRSLTKWENRGWIGVANREILKCAISLLRKRRGRTIMRKVKGHSGLEGNDKADALANLGATKAALPSTNTTPAKETSPTGAKLCEMTQSLLYQGIMERKKKEERRTTIVHLDMIRWAVKERSGDLPTTKRIWKSTQDRTLTKETRAFLWKAIHGGYKIGAYWDKIPNYETRGRCPICGVTEDMEHILIACDAPWRKEVWRLAEQLAELRGIKWKEQTLGSVLGAQLITPESTGGNTPPANRRFNTIVITESARTIWKIRCSWKIGKQANPDDIPTVREIRSRWQEALSRRVKLDCLATDRKRFKKRALPEKLVKDTWGSLIPEESPPHKASSEIIRVLVGIG